MQTNILILRFENEISPYEVPYFRGAVIAALENKDTLFHNHMEDKLRYAYPLIQYKRIHQKAAIVCLGKGTEVIGNLFSAGMKEMVLGSRTITPVLESVRPFRFNVQVWNNAFHYRITRWVALNEKNYNSFESLPSLTDKITMLERILIGNILSFAKGIGIHFDKQVECKITSLSEQYSIDYKAISFHAFNVGIVTNVSLPDFIGLGKHASLNCGIVTKIIAKKNSDNG